MYSELFSSAHQIRYDCMCDRMVDSSKVLAAAMLGSSSLRSMNGGLKSPLRQIADKPSYSRNLVSILVLIEFAGLGRLKKIRLPQV